MPCPIIRTLKWSVNVLQLMLSRGYDAIIKSTEDSKMKNTKITALDIIRIAAGVVAICFFLISMFVSTQPYLMIGLGLVAIETVINVLQRCKGYNKPKKEN